MEDIIRETLNEIDHGCDGFSYEIYKFIQDNAIQRHNYKFLCGYSMHTEFPQLKMFEVENSTIPDLNVARNRIIKITLEIDEDELRRIVHGD